MAKKRGDRGDARPTVPPEAMDAFRAWGRQGGKKRARKLSDDQRRELARKASVARWSRAKKSTKKA